MCLLYAAVDEPAVEAVAAAVEAVAVADAPAGIVDLRTHILFPAELTSLSCVLSCAEFLSGCLFLGSRASTGG